MDRGLDTHGPGSLCSIRITLNHVNIFFWCFPVRMNSKGHNGDWLTIYLLLAPFLSWPHILTFYLFFPLLFWIKYLHSVLSYQLSEGCPQNEGLVWELGVPVVKVKQSLRVKITRSAIVGTLCQLEKFRSLTEGLIRESELLLFKYPQPVQEKHTEVVWVLHSAWLEVRVSLLTI